MATIRVTQIRDGVYDVVVDDGRGTTAHEVTVWPSDLARYAPDATPEALVEASFAFLLEREPKEAILRRFELPVIEQYFPELCDADCRDAGRVTPKPPIRVIRAPAASATMPAWLLRFWLLSPTTWRS